MFLRALPDLIFSRLTPRRVFQLTSIQVPVISAHAFHNKEPVLFTPLLNRSDTPIREFVSSRDKEIICLNTRTAYGGPSTAKLYLDEKHVEWMSDRVLQHVLEDLRTRIPEKLMNEADVRLEPGGPANAKKGTLDVHRGDTYQFGYFLRKTEAHSVVIKTRRFVLAPPVPRSRAPLPPPEDSPAEQPGKGKRKRAPRKKKEAVKQPAKKRSTAKGKGKVHAVDSDSEEEEIIDIPRNEDDTPAPSSASAPLRRSSRRTTVATGTYREDDGEEQEQQRADSDVEMVDDTGGEPAPEPEREALPGDLPFDASGLITMDAEEKSPAQSVRVKSEDPEVQLVSPRNAPAEEVRPTPAPGDDASMPLDIDAEEEEEKPKPILKMSYKGYNIHGKCICVIVEPYPPIRAPSRAVSLAPTGVRAPRSPSIAPPNYIPPSVAAQRRERTPLFLPDDDRERSMTPAPWGAHEERILPPVPLFSDEPSGGEKNMGFEDGGMFELSQILQSVGGYPAGAAEDDDELDGAVLFGDADEIRALQ